MVKILLSLTLLFMTSLSAWADTRYELRVDGLACPYCAYGIEKKLSALDEVKDESLEIKINEGLVLFRTEADKPISEAKLERLIDDAGFTLRGVETQVLEK